MRVYERNKNDINKGCISIPYGYEKIKDYSFFEDSELIEVNIPDSVTQIGMGAFARCYNS